MPLIMHLIVVANPLENDFATSVTVESRPVQRGEIVDMVLSGRKTAADVARLFGIHPATVSRLISRARRLTYDSEQTLQ